MSFFIFIPDLGRSREPSGAESSSGNHQHQLNIATIQQDMASAAADIITSPNEVVAIIANDISQDSCSEQQCQEFGNNESSFLLPKEEECPLPITGVGNCQQENGECHNKEYLCPLQKSVAIIKVNIRDLMDKTIADKLPFLCPTPQENSYKPSQDEKLPC